jgi:hypothetical protein
MNNAFTARCKISPDRAFVCFSFVSLLLSRIKKSVPGLLPNFNFMLLFLILLNSRDDGMRKNNLKVPKREMTIAGRYK